MTNWGVHPTCRQPAFTTHIAWEVMPHLTSIKKTLVYVNETLS